MNDCPKSMSGYHEFDQRMDNCQACGVSRSAMACAKVFTPSVPEGVDFEGGLRSIGIDESAPLTEVDWMRIHDAAVTQAALVKARRATDNQLIQNSWPFQTGEGIGPLYNQISPQNWVTRQSYQFAPPSPPLTYERFDAIIREVAAEKAPRCRVVTDCNQTGFMAEFDLRGLKATLSTSPCEEAGFPRLVSNLIDGLVLLLGKREAGK